MPEARGETWQILIVDDDVGDRMTLRRMVGRSGLECQVHEAASLEEALALKTRIVPDFAFVDYRLGGEDGMAVIGQLLQTWPGIAVAMATGNGSEHTAVEAIHAGAGDYIRKDDLSPTSVRQCIESTIKLAAMRNRLDDQRKELESFARVLAHDMAAPMRGIRILADVFDEQIAEEAYDDSRATARKLRALVGRMSGLLDSLKSYIFMDRDPRSDPLSAATVVQAALDNLSADIIATHAEVTISDLPVIQGDRDQLVQLFQNLIANAIKFCRTGIPLIHIDADDTSVEEIVLRIRDNGIGIAAEHLDKIFQPFVRLHGTSEFSGTGLGLATCQRIMHRHHGRIWAEPVSSGGTRFNMAFPRDGKGPKHKALADPA